MNIYLWMNTIKAFPQIIRAIFQFSNKGREDKEGKESLIFENLEVTIWKFDKVSDPR